MAFLGFEIKRTKSKKDTLKTQTTPKKSKVVVPAGRVSQPDASKDFDFAHVGQRFKVVKPTVPFEWIPVIRNLYKTNENVGSVLNDLIQLTNTGHEIKFDQSVKADKAEKMRSHLREATKKWGYGTAGIDGLINKWIAQIWISGALSIEFVPNSLLTALESPVLVNPENIRFSLQKKGYEPYQKTNKLYSKEGEYIKLNQNTYVYCALLGDEDAPYGIPPFLTALDAIANQKDMKENIKHIMNQVGLLGYLEAKVAKPNQNDGENDTKYAGRLTQLLNDTKTAMLAGFKKGIVVGYEEDHDFEFHSTTKNLNGVSDIFNMNETQIANGLKSSPAFIGQDKGGGEGQLGIVFTKMLSQLRNVHKILSHVLQFGYDLELRLMGFDPKGLKVEFSTSTITDDMKYQQAREIKQRVSHNLWVDGIIGPNQYANEMGYQKPDRKVEAPEPGADSSGAGQKKKEKREKDKDKSDRKVREKGNPNPKRKDDKTQ